MGSFIFIYKLNFQSVINGFYFRFALTLWSSNLMCVYEVGCTLEWKQYGGPFKISITDCVDIFQYKIIYVWQTYYD